MQRTIIKQPNSIKLDIKQFDKLFVGCLILTHDNRLLLQQRDEDAVTFPGVIATFGGKIECGEEPLVALYRELQEELGAVVTPNTPKFIGAISESYTNHREVVFEYLWHDKDNTITGCYEGQSVYFATANDIIQHKNVMDDVKWLVQECLDKELIK